MRIVDVHHHAAPACYLEGLVAQGVDPAAEDGFPTPARDEASELAFLDAAHIDRAILSLSSPHVYHGDAAAATALARQVNDCFATLRQRHPGRLSFAACLPTPCVDASVAEVARAYDELGAVGVKLPSNSGGVYLGDARLDPLMAELERRRAVAIIHPTRPPVVPGQVFTAGPVPLFEFVADTTRAVLNLVTTGTLDRYPHVRWVVPHCGSFLPEVAHRMAGISQVLVPRGMMAEVDVLGSLGRLYYDLAGDALPVMLPALLRITEPSHLLYGSDYPYTPSGLALRKQRALLAAPELQGHLDEAFHANTERLFWG